MWDSGNTVSGKSKHPLSSRGSFINSRFNDLSCRGSRGSTSITLAPVAVNGIRIKKNKILNTCLT